MSFPATVASNNTDISTRTKSKAKSRSFRMDALHILTLFNVAVALPILDGHSRNAKFLIAERAKPLDIILLVLVLCLLLPGLLVAFEWLVGLINQKARNLVHALLVQIMFIAIAASIITRLADTPGVVVAAAGLAVGIVAALLYVRFQALRLFITYLSIGLLAIPVNFLFLSDVSEVLLPSGSAAVLPVEVESTAPVVMLVFDELPLVSLLDGNGQIDADLYPNFAELAGDSHFFRNATTVSDFTVNSVPAMLTGLAPDIDRLPNSEHFPNNLFTLLGDNYAMQVDEPMTDLCPDSLCEEDPLAMSERLELLRANVLGAHLPAVVTSTDRGARFTDFTQAIEPATQPTLYFLHTILPHAAWQHLPSGKFYTLTRSKPGLHEDQTWTADEELITQMYQRHLLQVQYADTLLGELIARLNSSDIYDRAMIVVVADHGVSFQPEAEYRDFETTTAVDILPVPLLIKQPRQTEAVVSDQNVQTIDILPTIADVLDIQLPWETDGHSVFDASLPERQEKTFTDSTGERFAFGPTIDGIDEAVAHKLSLFGTEDDPKNLFKLGLYRDLVGRSIDELTISVPSDVSISLDDEERYANVDLSDDFLPALITGKLENIQDQGRDVHVAVALNGTIQAVVQAYESEGDVRFSAVVPESSFQAGSNEVEIIIVSGAEDAPDIQRVNR